MTKTKGFDALDVYDAPNQYVGGFPVIAVRAPFGNHYRIVAQVPVSEARYAPLFAEAPNLLAALRMIAGQAETESGTFARGAEAIARAAIARVEP